MRATSLVVLLAVCAWGVEAPPAQTQAVEHPFHGVTHITRTETSPRNLKIHIVQIDLTAPGISFKVTPPGGTRETVRQTTLAFLNQERAQIAINAHFFLPFPSADRDVWLIGLAASNGNVYSSFEAPVQSYAIVSYAPAINIDASNHAGIVHYDPTFPDGKHVRENIVLWNALAGSAQIITNGVKTIPRYRDAENPDGELVLGGPGNYSNSRSWYDRPRARAAIGLSRDNKTLFLFTADESPAAASRGMTIGEVADLLIKDYSVYNALNLDGGGSTSLAMEDPSVRLGRIVNVPSDEPNGRSVGSNLAIFAAGSAGGQSELGPGGIARLAWLAGSWQTGPGRRRQVEEHWTQPVGAVMIGMGRTAAGGKTVEFEYLRIEERLDGIYYIAHPNARHPGTEFKLTSLTAEEVTFENPSHDFPKRIHYKKNSDGSITASVDGGEGTRATSFQYLSVRKR